MKNTVCKEFQRRHHVPTSGFKLVLILQHRRESQIIERWTRPKFSLSTRVSCRLRLTHATCRQMWFHQPYGAASWGKPRARLLTPRLKSEAGNNLSTLEGWMKAFERLSWSHYIDKLLMKNNARRIRAPLCFNTANKRKFNKTVALLQKLQLMSNSCVLYIHYNDI